MAAPSLEYRNWLTSNTFLSTYFKQPQNPFASILNPEYPKSQDHRPFQSQITHFFLFLTSSTASFPTKLPSTIYVQDEVEKKNQEFNNALDVLQTIEHQKHILLNWNLRFDFVFKANKLQLLSKLWLSWHTLQVSRGLVICVPMGLIRGGIDSMEKQDLLLRWNLRSNQHWTNPRRETEPFYRWWFARPCRDVYYEGSEN